MAWKKIENKQTLSFENYFITLSWRKILKELSTFDVNYLERYYEEDEYLFEEKDKREIESRIKYPDSYICKFELYKDRRKRQIETYGYHCCSLFSGGRISLNNKMTKEEIEKKLKEIENSERFHQFTTYIDFNN